MTAKSADSSDLHVTTPISRTIEAHPLLSIKGIAEVKGTPPLNTHLPIPVIGIHRGSIVRPRGRGKAFYVSRCVVVDPNCVG